MRSNTVFVLSLSSFGEAIQFSGLTLLVPPTVPGTIDNIGALMVIDVSLGIVAFAYWLIHRPDYSPYQRPLGILLLALQSVILGLILAIGGVVLLFLPVPGIIAVFFGGIGIGLIVLGKGLFDGKTWASVIMFILTVIGFIVGIVLGLIVSQLGFGIPLLSLFQLWYLRRPNVSTFFKLNGYFNDERSSPDRQSLGHEVASVQER